MKSPTVRRWVKRVDQGWWALRLKAQTVLARSNLPAILGGGAAVLLVVLILLSRAFSVSCPADADCLTLRELREGEPLPEAMHVYDRDGELIAEVGGPMRRALSPEEVPELLAQAFVAVEDRRFWEHGGVDARGVLRAAVRNLREGGISEGASTIPMQLVRTLWAESLRDVGPWRRKVIEARTAPRLIEDLGHARVLTLYLNAIYMGNGIYGVERASRHYFGVGVDSMSLGQIATLVGMTRSPEFYAPRRHPERARTVRGVVLATLANAGLVTSEEAERAASADLDLSPIDSTTTDLRRRTHFTEAVARELGVVAPDLRDRPGLEVHTTLDSHAQTEGRTALVAQLEAIEAGRHGPFEADSAARLEGALVALDPTSGAVRAWIGGRSFGESQFDRVEQSRRQVGSLVKPFLMASALERGYGSLYLVSADSTPIETSTGEWLPADHVKESSLPLREAVVRSSNRAAAHLAATLGVETVAQVGQRVGIESPIPAVPASAIGAFDASLVDMTAAYLPFGNGGRVVEPYLIERIADSRGTELWVRPDTIQGTQVLDAAVAYVVLDALRAVVDRGTGYGARAAGYRGPAAGKTGTTNDSRDAWFVGLTTELVAGVWIGFDQPREIVTDRGGGALAAPVWGTWMEGLRRNPRPSRRAWIPPPGVERVRYDPVSGEVLDVDCAGVFGRDFQEAWVLNGRYIRRRCTTGVLGWLERLWNRVTPGGEAERLQPIGQNNRIPPPRRNRR